MEKKDRDEDFIARIHKETSRFRSSAPPLDRIPSIFKKFAAKSIPLPWDLEPSGLSVERSIEARSSCRKFFGSMDVRKLSTLLYYAAGFRGLIDTELGILRRANFPSAGSRHSLEVYFVAQRITGIKDGIYHYDPESHSLDLLGDVHETERRGLVNDSNLLNANLLIFISSMHQRSSFKYGPRSYRFIHIEAGHLGQNIYLLSEALGLGACGIGNWDEPLAKKLFHILEDQEILLYTFAVGSKDHSSQESREEEM